MTEASREVGVVLRRRAIDNPWIDHMWSPVTILETVPATAPWTVLSQEADATLITLALRSSICSAPRRPITATILSTVRRKYGSRCGVRTVDRNLN